LEKQGLSEAVARIRYAFQSERLFGKKAHRKQVGRITFMNGKQTLSKNQEETESNFRRKMAAIGLYFQFVQSPIDNR